MPEVQQVALALFTEIATIEHLMRNRFDRAKPAGLNETQFSILTHLISRVPPPGQTLASLAWAFQQDVSDMAACVAELSERGFLVDRGGMIALTPAGLAAHKAALDLMTLEVKPMLGDIPIAALAETVERLQDIRRTLDNQPDR